MNRFEVLAVETDASGARYQPGSTYPLEGNTFGQELIKAGRARMTCPLGQCIGINFMATNPGKVVVETLKGLKDELERTATGIVEEAAAQSERTKNGFHKIKQVVLDEWKQANDEVEDFLNQLTNGGPPLEK